MRANPDEAATALLLEAPAMALNPNSRLNGARSLRQRLLGRQHNRGGAGRPSAIGPAVVGAPGAAAALPGRR